MLDVIEKRQSIRKYTDQKVEADKITDLLKAAMRAPTARNKQEWRFVVVEDRETLDLIPTMSPYTTMMKEAPLAIIVLGDKTEIPDDAYIYVDCAAAIQNILLEGVHLGLGTCWCAIGPNEDRMEAFRNHFKFPEHLLPVAVVAVGYANETKPLQERFDPSKITYYKP